MKIGIVGGTGNISESIVKLLLAQGHEVVCINRGSSGTVPEGVRCIKMDRHDHGKFEKTMQAERFDAAIDMICFTAEDASSSLRAFRGVGVFVHCSTVCTYGIKYDWLPATEDHPLRPISDYGRNKVAADEFYLEAHSREKFPVVIIKPSTTYGPRLGLLRQVSWDFSWLDRIRKGKPIIVCGEGNAIHQFLHVDDAALGFAGVLNNPNCIGQTYNLVRRECITWADYHRTAMKVIGREVELVGIPFAKLTSFDIPNFGITEDIFAHHVFYSPEKLMRDVPGFQPRITLEAGMTRVLASLDSHARIPNSDHIKWEDEIISKQKSKKGKIAQ
jgi:nucleoside-diphosphate-sugar epimerase